jgi:DNA/RNA-binding domain of Phe-tRNA-synthetase-like protein
VEHTPEPWSRRPEDWGMIVDADNHPVANTEMQIRIPNDWHGEPSNWSEGRCKAPPEITANTDRIVACVNALANLNPEGVRDVVEALEGCIEHMEHSTPQGRQAWESARAALAKIKTATTKDRR